MCGGWVWGSVVGVVSRRPPPPALRGAPRGEPSISGVLAVLLDYPSHRTHGRYIMGPPMGNSLFCYVIGFVLFLFVFIFVVFLFVCFFICVFLFCFCFFCCFVVCDWFADIGLRSAFSEARLCRGRYQQTNHFVEIEPASRRNDRMSSYPP